MRIIVKWLLINVFWKRQSVITRSFHYVNTFGMSIQDLEWKGWCHSWIDKKEMAMDQAYIGNILKEAIFWMPEKRKRGRLNTDCSKSPSFSLSFIEWGPKTSTKLSKTRSENCGGFMRALHTLKRTDDDNWEKFYWNATVVSKLIGNYDGNYNVWLVTLIMINFNSHWL